MLKYLAYGSNLHPGRLQKRVPSAEVIEVVQLQGWQLRFHKRSKDASGKCNIIQTDQPADLIFGVIYEINPAEKSRLDRAEGMGSGYDERQVSVNGHRDVFFYQATDIDDALKPYTWYREYVLLGARYHELPEVYLQELETVEAWQDPDNDRHAKHIYLLNCLKNW